MITSFFQILPGAGNSACFFKFVLFFIEIYYNFNHWDVVDHIPRKFFYTYIISNSPPHLTNDSADHGLTEQ